MENWSGALLFFLALGSLWIVRRVVRQPFDVLCDLAEEHDLREKGSARSIRASGRVVLGGNFWEMGILTHGERRIFHRHQRAILVAGTLVPPTLAYFWGERSVSTLALAGSIGFVLSYLSFSRQRRVLKERFKRDVEFHLPTVMERVVMGVQAGLDILPALRVIVELDEASSEGPNSVSKLLRIVHDLTVHGSQFEDALRLIASKTPCAALRHAFIHLALARKEGGELILPLRELSDSTQLHFQDAIEEEIAKMPVRATAPLVCVFAGLMICFMTIPVLQVISVTDRAQISTTQEPGGGQ